MVLRCANLITPRSRAWTCLDQETMLLFFSAEYINMVHVFEAGLGESCSDFALYLLFVWDAIVSCWTKQFDDVLASNGPALHCLWIMFFFATLVGWEHLAQQAKVRQPTSLTVNACLCGSHAQNICMLELAVRKGHRQLQTIQWIRRTRTIQRWRIAGDPWNILKCIVTVDPLYLGSWVRWAGVGDGHGFGWCYQLLSCRGPLWKLVKFVKKSFQVCPISVVLGLKWILYHSDEFGWFKSFLPFVVSHCLCNWYDFDGSGVPISNGA